MKIELLAEDDLVMRYYRMLCGRRVCSNCNYWSENRGFCSNTKNMEILSAKLEDIIVEELDYKK